MVQGRLMGQDIFGAEQSFVEHFLPAGIQLRVGQWAHSGDLVSVGYPIPAASLVLDGL